MQAVTKHRKTPAPAWFCAATPVETKMPLPTMIPMPLPP